MSSVGPGALVGYRASVGQGARIAPDAVVHRNGILRAYSVLGEQVHARAPSDIHTETVIEDHVTIGRQVTIGRGVVVGATA